MTIPEFISATILILVVAIWLSGFGIRNRLIQFDCFRIIAQYYLTCHRNIYGYDSSYVEWSIKHYSSYVE